MFEIADSRLDAVDWMPGLTPFVWQQATVDVSGFNSEPDPVDPTFDYGSKRYNAWIKLAVLNGQGFTVTTSGSDYDTVLVLWKDIPGDWPVLLDYNDDDGETLQSMLSWGAEEDATYLIEVRPWSQSDIELGGLHTLVLNVGIGDIPSPGAATVEGSFSIGSWVKGTQRLTHHMVNDHHGAELATRVILSERVGQWEEQTPIQYVLAGLYERMLALESSNHRFSTLTIDAHVLAPGYTVEIDATERRSVFSVDSDKLGTISGSFTIGAWSIKAYAFTVSAVVIGGRTMTVDAVISL